MSETNMFNYTNQYQQNNNLIHPQNVSPSQSHPSGCLQSIIAELRDEIKSLKSDVCGMRKDIKELSESNKRSVTKLMEEVFAVKHENRQHHDYMSFDEENADFKKLPFVNMEELVKFNQDVQEDEEKLRQYKSVIAKTGGIGPSQFIRAAERKVFSDELATLYSWKGTIIKPSAENLFLITIIKNICHQKYKCTDKDINTVLQKHFVHAKDRIKTKKPKI